MFNSRSLRSTIIVVIVTMLVAEGVWATENERDGLTMEFVRIPAGSFNMGSPSSEADRDDNEGPVHQVQITKPFYMGRYEVTQAQWKAVMGTTVRQQRRKATLPWLLKGEGPEYPMHYVSWEEAVEFCKRLGRKFRLPTEAEWEYACRAGAQTRFYYGDDPNYSELDLHAWYESNSNNTTHPVGQKKPNAWGLYDMHGNVSEWCSDWFALLGGYKNAGSVDPMGPASARDPHRVCRGGSWLEEPEWCRSANREGRTETVRVDFIGFRIVFTGRARGGNDILEIALPNKAGRVVTTQEQERETRVRGLAIAGVVRDEAGTPTDGATIQILPIRDWSFREYVEGRFEVIWRPASPSARMEGYHFVARHAQRNLAVGMEITEDANALDVRLEPGAILTGKVVDRDGKGIGDATVAMELQTSNWPGGFLGFVKADAEGRFEIRALPPGYGYALSARSMGYRIGRVEVRSDDVRDNRIDLGPIVLARGEFSVSGVVVDVNGKPVANAEIFCTGEGQPGAGAVTDADGRFRVDGVFKGQVQITAGFRVRGYGSWDSWGGVNTEAGATNVKVVLNCSSAPLPKGRTCFPADTDVWVNGALVQISRVAPGQTVGKPGCAALAAPFGQIERLEEHVGAFECRDIVLQNGNRISVVDAHCFMLDSGRWIPAQDLRNGLRLKTLNGTVSIKSVTTRVVSFVGKVCNLKVKNSDQYMVGKDGVIVRDY